MSALFGHLRFISPGASNFPPASIAKKAIDNPLSAQPVRFMSHAAIMMSLQTMIDAERARGIEWSFGFRFGPTGYSAHLRDSELHVERRMPEGCDVVMTTTPEGLAAVIYGGAPIETVHPEGDIELARRFVNLFPLPEKVA